MPSDPHTPYKITQQPGGEWHLYRQGVPVDIEYDPEHAPLEEIFLWATQVVYAEDRVEVIRWTQTPESTTYTAEITAAIARRHNQK